MEDAGGKIGARLTLAVTSITLARKRVALEFLRRNSDYLSAGYCDSPDGLATDPSARVIAVTVLKRSIGHEYAHHLV